MLTLRIHLDDCRQDNGALHMITDSHRMGILDDDQIAQIVEDGAEVICEARRGSVLAMRPLVLHSSSPATAPSHRRVLHLEFAAQSLPGGLEWPVCRRIAES
jgi:ectoine hydroxylase-related dioxygenase (phytanoyl-CoA dioxygenase family)